MFEFIIIYSHRKTVSYLNIFLGTQLFVYLKFQKALKPYDENNSWITYFLPFTSSPVWPPNSEDPEVSGELRVEEPHIRSLEKSLPYASSQCRFPTKIRSEEKEGRVSIWWNVLCDCLMRLGIQLPKWTLMRLNDWSFSWKWTK